ncbi:hypothetical protein C8F04DRAFT_1074224 [Mycena alexandri]|uniref:Uncharacterized protein n=1 Tax=Mycena alexandri TaxID=1745969 RepID=A0AAD6XCT0_9AGAR|nr:hypothetical protein C8F04DRAFT_1074224 [Mycena alexandri]
MNLSILPRLKYAASLTNALRAQPGQLAYTKDQPSITGAFYEFLRAGGLSLWSEESEFLDSLPPRRRLGRPCIILERLPDGYATVCFIGKIKGTRFSPIGRLFAVPMAKRSVSSTDPLNAFPESPSFPSIQLTKPSGYYANSGRYDKYDFHGRFCIFAIPVVRRVWLFPGGPRRLVPGDLERLLEMVDEKVQMCQSGHAVLRREQLEWAQTYKGLWKFLNPKEYGEIKPKHYLGI